MTGEIQIEIDLKDVFKQIQAYKSEFTPASVIKSVGLRSLRWVTKNFDSEGASVGGWIPLSPKTIERRRQGSSKILKDTGSLRQSFDLYGTKGIKVFSDKFEIGSVLKYAATHHYGDDSRGIPQRRILMDGRTGTELGINLLKARLKQLNRKYG